MKVLKIWMIEKRPILDKSGKEEDINANCKFSSAKLAEYERFFHC